MFAIIVAGGSGTRLGGDIPKQFRLINGIPMLACSLMRFHEADKETRIFLVLPAEHISYWESLEISKQIPHTVIAGGRERFHSVKNALNAIAGDEGRVTNAGEKEIVSIHDAARPLVSALLINNTFKEAKRYGSAIPVTPVPYSLREKKDDKWVATDRRNYRVVQTPQVFNLVNLLEAYEQEFSNFFTDDASVYEAAGFEVNLVEGEEQNIKVTTSEDMEWVSWKLK